MPTNHDYRNGKKAGRALTPRIGIPLPTSSDLAYNNRYWSDYALAVTRSGGEAVAIPLIDAEERLLDARERQRILGSCHGFVLPGSPADVDPERYGHTPEPATAAPDLAREATDGAVLECAERRGLPILGICFGLQSLNVLQGGTLVQDLRPVPVNHAAGPQVGVAHSVSVASMSLLGGLLSATEAPAHGQFRRLSVNSSHHQAIAIPGEGFTVVARAGEDGVIEAMEAKVGRASLVGVQWHPERSLDTSAASKAVFLWLVMAAADAGESEGTSDAGDL